MAYLITEECISCAACIHECPNEAIFENDELQYEINPDKCTECFGLFDEPQCKSVCPVEDAILIDKSRIKESCV